MGQNLRAAFVCVACTLVSASAGCQFSAEVSDDASLLCVSSNDCPSARVCLENTGRCVSAAAECIVVNEPVAVPAPDGNACSEGICVAGACVAPRCGDGLLTEPEACDDGNSDDTDGCVLDCRVARCGDGVIQAGIEACDDGAGNREDGACLPTCQENVCGDGNLLVGVEECDDGNQDSLDACTPGCIAAVCGDGLRNRLDDAEECDDENLVDTDGCLSSCTLARCGDGLVHAGVEECDDGAANADDASCLPTCRLNVCGDGAVRAGVEACDDGNANPFDDCVPPCLIATCGDGLVNQLGGEECDDGNLTSFDGCSAQCSRSRAWSVDIGAPIPHGVAPVTFGEVGGLGIAVVTEANQVVALTFETGAEQWRVQLDAPIVSLLGTRLSVVVATEDGTVHWIESSGAAAGTVVWTEALAADGGRARLAAASPDRIVVVDGEGALHTRDRTGAAQPFHGAGDPGIPYYPTTRPRDLQPSASCTTCAATVFNRVEGEPLSLLEVGGIATAMGPTVWFWHLYSNCEPLATPLPDGATAAGRVSIVALGGAALAGAVRTEQGAIVQLTTDNPVCGAPMQTSRFTPPSGFVTDPVLIQSFFEPGTPTIIAATADGTLHHFRFDEDAVAVPNPGWQDVQVGAPVSTAPAVDLEQNVYLVDDTGRVLGFSLQGTRRTIGDVGGAPAGSPIVRDGAVIVATRAGTVAALEGGGSAPDPRWWARDGGQSDGAAAGGSCRQAAAEPGLLAAAALLWVHRATRRQNRPRRHGR